MQVNELDQRICWNKFIPLFKSFKWYALKRNFYGLYWFHVCISLICQSYSTMLWYSLLYRLGSSFGSYGKNIVHSGFSKGSQKYVYVVYWTWIIVCMHHNRKKFSAFFLIYRDTHKMQSRHHSLSQIYELPFFA